MHVYVFNISIPLVCIWIYEDHCFECMYYLWGFVCELPEILVSCEYFEILLVSYSSSHLSTTCLPHAVNWVDSSYHHLSLYFFPIVIYLLDFIPFIFTFITLIYLLILNMMFHSTSLSSYLSHHMLHFLHHIIIIGASIGCLCVHGS